MKLFSRLPIFVAALLSLYAAVAHAAHPVFVLNSQDANVTVYDPQTWKPIKTIPTGKEPHHLYMSPDEKSVIVANAFSDSLTFIDPQTAVVQRVVLNIKDPYHLRFSPDMKWFVVASNRVNHVDIYKWNGKDLTLVKSIPSAKTPSHIWIDSKSTTAYVSMQDSDELVSINLATQSVNWRAPTGHMLADVFVTPDDKTLFTALTGGDGVEVYDVSGGTPPRFIKKIVTKLGAHAFRIVGDKRHIYVSNRGSDSISKIDYVKQELVSTFPVPGGPDCMDISSDGTLMMTTARWARKLTLIDLRDQKIIAQLPVGRSPHGVWTLDHAVRQQMP